ncbi:MAG: cupin domain-containing protein [Pseudomonadota bacterium]
MAQYHPSEDLLAAYVSGAADEPTEALIAAHLTFCPECQEAASRHEEIAGALFERFDGAVAETRSGANAITQCAIDSVSADHKGAPPGSLSEIAPRPLADYIFARAGAADLDAMKWTFYGPGIKRAILVGSRDGALVRLVKARPGAKFPDHHHGSDELTLVLTGAYRDHTGRYGVGDVQCAEASLSHQPVIEDEGVCYAFVVSEKPAIPKGLTAKIVQRVIRG